MNLAKSLRPSIHKLCPFPLRDVCAHLAGPSLCRCRPTLSSHPLAPPSKKHLFECALGHLPMLRIGQQQLMMNRGRRPWQWQWQNAMGGGECLRFGTHLFSAGQPLFAPAMDWPVGTASLPLPSPTLVRSARPNNPVLFTTAMSPSGTISGGLFLRK